jgi:hypothetical protein
MLAAAQCFFEQLDTFDGTLTLGSQFGAAESQAQFFQPLVVAASDGAQAVRLMASSHGLRVLLHGLVPRSRCMVHFNVYTDNLYTDNL